MHGEVGFYLRNCTEICTTRRLEFFVLFWLFFCFVRGRLRVEFYCRAASLPHVVPHREERRGQKFPLACFVTAGLVNPQECRRRRDPRFTDRSSTKPCGKSRSATRTYLLSVPVLTDPCGKLLLHSSSERES